MNRQIEDGIREIVRDAVDSAMTAISFNMTDVLDRLLYSVKLDLEKEDLVGAIGNVVRAVVATSRYSDHEDSYPIWDSKSVGVEMRALARKLKDHGITQLDQ